MAKFTLAQLRNINIFGTPVTGKKFSAYDIISSYQDNTGDNIPSQTSNSGKFLTTNGSALSWSLPIPSQTSNSGKLLTTNGTAASWATTASLLATWAATLGDYTDDTAAATGGVAVGGFYWDTDGSLHKRLV